MWFSIFGCHYLFPNKKLKNITKSIDIRANMCGRIRYCL